MEFYEISNTQKLQLGKRVVTVAIIKSGCCKLAGKTRQRAKVINPRSTKPSRHTVHHFLGSLDSFYPGGLGVSCHKTNMTVSSDLLTDRDDLHD